MEIVVGERSNLLAIKANDISWAKYFSMIARSVKLRCLLIVCSFLVRQPRNIINKLLDL